MNYAMWARRPFEPNVGSTKQNVKLVVYFDSVCTTWSWPNSGLQALLMPFKILSVCGVIDGEGE